MLKQILQFLFAFKSKKTNFGKAILKVLFLLLISKFYCISKQIPQALRVHSKV